MQSIGQLMAIRGQMSDIALRNQQIQASRTQEAERAALTEKYQQEVVQAREMQKAKQSMGGFIAFDERGIPSEIVKPYRWELAIDRALRRFVFNVVMLTVSVRHKGTT